MLLLANPNRRTLMKITKYLLISLTVGLTACSVTPEECDPSQEQSLLKKVQCQHSVFNANGSGVSAADTRIQQKEEQLWQSQEELRLAQETLADLEQQLAVSNQSITEEKAALDTINKKLNKLLVAVKKNKSTQKAKAAEVASIEAQMKALNNANSAVERRAIMDSLSKKMSRSLRASGKTK